jgi:hypothetical protein
LKVQPLLVLRRTMNACRPHSPMLHSSAHTPAVGRQRTAGSGQRAAGSGQRAAGSGQRAAGSGQRAVGSGQWAAGRNQQAAVGSQHSQACLCLCLTAAGEKQAIAGTIVAEATAPCSKSAEWLTDRLTQPPPSPAMHLCEAATLALHHFLLATRVVGFQRWQEGAIVQDPLEE